MHEVLKFPIINPTSILEETPVASALQVQMQNVVFANKDTPILRGINLDLSTDKLTVLMGPNGAGKSVLLRLINGLLTPTSGEILWDGGPLSRPIRRAQAFVFQKPVLLRRSVKANLKFALGLRAPLDQAAKLKAALQEAGLDHLADRPARVLSGGEQQRLALARALILEPKLLLLDEPTANLDPASTLSIEQSIAKARKRGVKIILITHDPHQARRLGEEVLFLHSGRITEHTPAHQFFKAAQSPEARAYLAGEIVI